MNEMIAVKTLLHKTSAELNAWRTAKTLLWEKYAPDFPLFQFLRQDEPGLSMMLALLLDPKETHGQGDRYLLEFLKIVNAGTAGDTNTPQHISSDEISVQTEVRTTGQRRADIVVESPTYTLLIENKPWALDQKDQISDYSRWLKPTPPRLKKIVYLCGREPNNDSITQAELERLRGEGHYVRVDFVKIHRWLTNCLALTVPNTVRTFIGALIEYVSTRILKKEPQAMHDPHIRTLMAENIEAAFAIANSFTQLKQEILEKFLVKLSMRLEKQGFVLALPPNDDQREQTGGTSVLNANKTGSWCSWFTVYRKERREQQEAGGYCLAFSFESPNHKDLIWGIARNKEPCMLDPALVAEIRKKMTERFGHRAHKDTDNWPWYQNADKVNGLIANNWGISAAPWMSMRAPDDEKSLANTFVRLAVDAHEVLDDVVSWQSQNGV